MTTLLSLVELEENQSYILATDQARQVVSERTSIKWTSLLNVESHRLSKMCSSPDHHTREIL